MQIDIYSSKEKAEVRIYQMRREKRIVAKYWRDRGILHPRLRDKENLPLVDFLSRNLENKREFRES